MLILICALILLLLLPNFEFGIFWSMRILRLTCWLNKHMALTSVGVIFVSKKSQCNKIGCFVCRPACLGRLSRLFRLAKPTCPGKHWVSLFWVPAMLRPIWMTGELPYWSIYEIQTLELIKVFGRVHSRLFCTMVSYTEELLKTCSLSVSDLVK